MSLFEDTNPKKLSELLGQIDSRMTALPDFQRDFVWDPTATQELIVSIANNFPAGSVLRVRDKNKAFAAREFDGAPRLDGHIHTFLVLDGQQRLTSLYQAFYGAGDHRYFVDLKKLMDGKDFEEAISHARAGSNWVKAHESFEAQKKDLIIPLSLLRSGAGGFLDWIFAYSNELPDEQKVPTQKALKAVSDQWFKTIDEYQFPVVTLSDEVKPDALCTIFETLNRTGVKLTAFELLTARFWPSGINLRSLWETATASYPILRKYGVDPYYLLQATSLVSRATPSCKRAEVLDLTAPQIEAWWDRIVEGMQLGLNILCDDCKVVSAKWMPYQTMLVPLSAVLAQIGPAKTPLFGAQRERLKRWFWCAVFMQQYENAPNSQSAKDFSDLIAWLNGGSEPETVSTFKFDPSVLRDTTPRQRAVYRGTMCLILGSAGGTRDFHTQSVITGKLIEEEGIDDHHIFPAAYLEKKKGVKDARLRDCILNRTLIDRQTNQLISDRAPSDYLHEMQQTPGFPFDNVLTSHCLPVGTSSPLLSNDFETFLVWRQEQLWKEIQRVTGSNVPVPVEVATEVVG